MKKVRNFRHFKHSSSYEAIKATALMIVITIVLSIIAIVSFYIFIDDGGVSINAMNNMVYTDSESINPQNTYNQNAENNINNTNNELESANSTCYDKSHNEPKKQESEPKKQVIKSRANDKAGNTKMNVTAKTKKHDDNNLATLSKNDDGIINSKPNKTDFTEWNKTADWRLIVINKDTLLPDDFSVILGRCKEKEVDVRITDELERMIEDCHSLSGPIWISSGYRNGKYQRGLFNNQIKFHMSQGLNRSNAELLASTIVAKPGTSEHHTGLAVDFNGAKDEFCNTPQYKWLSENCHKYGFVVRYQSDKKHITGIIYEPWHFRYVGKKHASIMKKRNMCLEEYVEELIMDGKICSTDK